MIGTYAAAIAVCGASLAIGQAAIGLCGQRRWSWLAPAVGLALVLAVCWGTVRLPGDGTISAIAVLVLVFASVAYLWGTLEGGGEALWVGAPVALVALLAASLPFIAEGHFGILGTSFNPDMSQHLLATARLAEGNGSQLLHQGYPLGAHSIVVALNKGLGIGLVQGFSGLSVAVLILAPLTALAAFADGRVSALLGSGAALVVGAAYLVASYFAQGAFKEILEALFVLAFALSLREASTPTWRDLQLRFVPSALIAVGAVYAYSFPGLLWLIGTAVLWSAAQFVLSKAGPSAGGTPVGAPHGAEDAQHPSTMGETGVTGPAVARSVLLASLAFLVLTAPEIGRMVDFHSFETFDPNGPGLGNLFGQVSPFEALGIWPSGDFRLAPGDGAVPAAAYFLGAAFGLVLLAWGTARCWRRRETAVLAALTTAAFAYAVARIEGTPYTAAKAIEIGAPLVALIILLGLLGDGAGEGRRVAGAPLRTIAAALFILAAGVCSLLALANAPVGPTSYSPALTGLRPLLAADSTVVLASPQLLADEHGSPYIAWELRGGRVCIETAAEADGAPPPGVRFVVTEGGLAKPPFPGLRLRQKAKPYVLWELSGPVAGKSPCPLIAVRQARQGAAR